MPAGRTHHLMKARTRNKRCKNCSKSFQVPARRGRTKDHCSATCRNAYRRKYTNTIKRETGTKCPGCQQLKFLEPYQQTCSKWCEEVCKLIEGGLTRKQAEFVADFEGWPKTYFPHRPRINDLKQLQRYDLALTAHDDGSWSYGDYRIVTCDSDFDNYEENMLGVRDYIADEEIPYAEIWRDPEAREWMDNNPNWVSGL